MMSRLSLRRWLRMRTRNIGWQEQRCQVGLLKYTRMLECSSHNQVFTHIVAGSSYTCPVQEWVGPNYTDIKLILVHPCYYVVALSLH